MNISIPSLEQVMQFVQHWPDLTILIGCSAFAQLLTLALEWWFLPTVTDALLQRRQRGLTFLFCWSVAASSSALLWWLIDPKDPALVRVTVSVIVGPFGFFAYPPIARVLTAKFPAIGSAWDCIRGKS